MTSATVCAESEDEVEMLAETPAAFVEQQGESTLVERPDVDKESIRAIPATPYRSFRRYLETGDLIFGSGQSRFLRVVRAVMKTSWRHVGIVVRMEELDRVMLLESDVRHGVRLVPLSRYFGEGLQAEPYHGDLVVARHTKVDPASAAINALVDYGVGLLSPLQGKVGSVDRTPRAASGFGDDGSRQRGLTCAEYVDACFAHHLGSGIPPLFRRNGRSISPDDIWSDPRVMPIRRLVVA